VGIRDLVIMRSFYLDYCLMDNVKLKLSLCTSWGRMGIWGVAPLILDLGTRRRWVTTCTRRSPYPRYEFSRNLGGCERIIHLQGIRCYFFSVSVIAVHLIVRCTPHGAVVSVGLLGAADPGLWLSCLFDKFLAKIIIFSNCVSGNSMLEVHDMEVILTQSHNCFLQLFEKDPRGLSR
jgi:hypothetical protein